MARKKEQEAENIGVDVQSVAIPLTSDHEIIKRLQTWFDKKYGANKGSRNANLFKFAMALHDFGINQTTTENHLLQYSQKDFNENEIKRLIK